MFAVSAYIIGLTIDEGTWKEKYTRIAQSENNVSPIAKVEGVAN